MCPQQQVLLRLLGPQRRTQPNIVAQLIQPRGQRLHLLPAQMLVRLHTQLPSRLLCIRQIQLTLIDAQDPLPMPQGHFVVGPVMRIILLARYRSEMHEHLRLHFLSRLAVRTGRAH
jgi:hypothetical protein